MPEISVVAETGRAAGSRPSRRLRAAGRVPGVLYGHGMDPVALSVEERELRHALAGGANSLISLGLGGASHLTMARAVQRHPIRHTLSHVDFVVVRRDELVTVEVPVVLVGEAVEVHRGDGLVDQQAFSIQVRALPGSIPSSIEVGIEELVIGQAIHLADLSLPDGVEALGDPETPIVAGQARHAAEAEAEAAEGEAAPGAEPAQAQAAASRSEAEG